MTIQMIKDLTGLSYRKLAERFCIPYRTMEDWSSGKRNPPPYVLSMMAEILQIDVSKDIE